MDLSVPIVGIVLGAILLFFGRRLFWLFVAAIGFAAGIEVAPHLVHEPTPILALSVALVLGFVGALLALFVQKIAVALGGFVVGGQLALALAASFRFAEGTNHLIVFAIGGVVGAVLLLSLFGWALILLSALVGAHLIMQRAQLPPSGTAIAFVALVVVGVVAQAATASRSRAPAD